MNTHTQALRLPTPVPPAPFLPTISATAQPLPQPIFRTCLVQLYTAFFPRFFLRVFIRLRLPFGQLVYKGFMCACICVCVHLSDLNWQVSSSAGCRFYFTKQLLALQHFDVTLLHTHTHLPCCETNKLILI